MLARTFTIALLSLALLPLRGFAAEPASLQETAEKLYKSLSDEQRKEATLPFNDKERKSEVFPNGPRAGIQIKAMKPDQQTLALAMLTGFVSESGKAKIEQVSKQTPNPGETAGLDRYYVCFFGEPGEGKTYAWRIAEHHMTVVDMEYHDGKIASFGPILLGSNPPVIWEDEEDKMIALYNAMSADERGKSEQPGKLVSSFKFEGHAIKVGDLSPSAKKAAAAVIENRLGFFSEPIQARVKQLIEAQGGLDSMEVAFWGEATKKCKDGGRWDFKLVGPHDGFLCDYESSRAHIHMSMKGSLADAK